ncbi:hypothetical protein [Nocardia sp. BMG51109]|uniref:hypothetical protein n=1 Tax=Nocardia sp. BMG51109 TaxID=1056816 RepID=UPI0012EC84FA|nr:hypothetical protein [Nocardia sp. BMG51109]
MLVRVLDTEELKNEREVSQKKEETPAATNPSDTAEASFYFRLPIPASWYQIAGSSAATLLITKIAEHR